MVLLGLHTLTSLHTNAVMDLQLAKLNGFDAIRATGYDDVWAVEVFSFYHAEWDPYLVVSESKRRLASYLAIG